MPESRVPSPGSGSIAPPTPTRTGRSRPRTMRSAGRRMPVPKPRSGLVLALFGPTASGKTAVAEALADRTGGEVVSADAMQAYRGLPLITNQPDRPTLLVGVWPLDHDGSVGEYQRLPPAAAGVAPAAGRRPGAPR